MAEETSEELPPIHNGNQIRFYRFHLDDLPDLEVPEGYRLRNYRPGDEKGWAAVLNAAFPDPNHPWTVEKIQHEFIEQKAFQPERIFFAEQEGEIAGVAAAWEVGDPTWGYVHWVAVNPEHQGKRLGRLVTLATLHRFREEGKRRTYLDTDESRIPAIRTYLSLGYQPDLRRPETVEMWERIKGVFATLQK